MLHIFLATILKCKLIDFYNTFTWGTHKWYYFWLYNER